MVIKSEHRQVFEIFSKGYLKKSFEKDLLSVLKVVNTHDQSEIKKSVSLLRQIFEVGILGKIVEVLRKIVKIEDIKKQIPDDCDKKNKFKAYIVDLLLAKSGGNLKPRYILKFLAGSPKYIHTKKISEIQSDEYISHSIYNLCDCFWSVCSEISHGGKSENKSVNYKLTPYTVPILLNILLDFFVWFKGFMAENN